MPSRKELFVEGKAPDLMVQFAKFFSTTGVSSFEFGYEVDGDDPDREPAPGEEITWYAEVAFPGGETERAEHRTADLQAGPVLATSELLSKLGANVAILDRRT